MKVAETSPNIKRSRTAMPPDTGTAAEVDVPRPRACHVFTRLFTSNTPRYFLELASYRIYLIK